MAAVRGSVDPRTASVITLRPMLSYARRSGVDVRAIQTELGIPLDVNDYDLRIPEAARRAIWERAAAASSDPSFGVHVAESAAVGDYDVLDFSLAYSATLGDAFGRFARFHRILADALEIRIDQRDGLVVLRRLHVTYRHEAEAVVGILVRRARTLTGRDGMPHEMRFAHAAPPDTGALESLFRCPMCFGAPATEIVFRAQDFQLPVLASDPKLVAVLDRHQAEILARLPADATLVERARRVIAEALPHGRPTLARTARAVGASQRTVQRALHLAGTSHRELVESVRRELAARMVGSSQLSVTEIAYLLGFSDVSGFRRTFKRWTGTSPAHRKHRAA